MSGPEKGINHIVDINANSKTRMKKIKKTVEIGKHGTGQFSINRNKKV